MSSLNLGRPLPLTVLTFNKAIILRTGIKRILKLTLLLSALGVGFAVFYYLFFLHLVRVPTSAMANTIVPGDHLVVQKRAFGEINRGDIIVFKYPKDTSVLYIKRVIGLPRETIEIRGKLVYINGKELSEERVMIVPDYEAEVLEELSTEGSGPYRVYYSFSDHTDESDPGYGTFGKGAPFQIPDNEYFVMGDSRDNTVDSRVWGTVPRNLVFGKPTLIYFSSTRDDEIRWARIFKKIKAG